MPPLEAPNPTELGVLAVLWEEELGPNQPLKLAEVHRRVCEKRREQGHPEPAPTTISSSLRRLVDKGLIGELTPAGVPVEPPAGKARGGRLTPRSRRTSSMLTPITRSPLTSYHVLHPPGDVLHTTWLVLLDAYPPQRRLDAVLDLARAMGLTREALLERLQNYPGPKKARG